MPKRTRDYKEGLYEDLQDAIEATSYLNAALSDSQESFLVALRNVADSRQMSHIASLAGIRRETIYRMLSPTGNPTCQNLISVLASVGLRLYVGPPTAVAGHPFDPTLAEKDDITRTATASVPFRKPCGMEVESISGEPANMLLREATDSEWLILSGGTSADWPAFQAGA